MSVYKRDYKLYIMYQTFSRKNTQKVSSLNFLMDFLIFGSGGAEEKLTILDKKKSKSYFKTISLT